MTNAPTGIPALDFVLTILGQFGYLITLGGTILENLFIIGSATPGEIVVMASGWVASRGALDWRLVWIASVTGTMIGSNISYFLGRKGGRPWIIKYGHRFHISEERLASAEEYFHRHGSKTVLLARFAAGVKNWVPVLAGASRMGLPWFEGYTLLGAVLYTSAMVSLGWFFGEQFDRLLKWVARAGYVGAAVFVGLIVFAVWGRRRVRRRREERRRESGTGAVSGSRAQRESEIHDEIERLEGTADEHPADEHATDEQPAEHPAPEHPVDDEG